MHASSSLSFGEFVSSCGLVRGTYVFGRVFVMADGAAHSLPSTNLEDPHVGCVDIISCVGLWLVWG